MSDEYIQKIRYLGELYPLDLRVDSSVKKINIKFDGITFILTSPIAGEFDINKILKAFYKKASKKVIEERLRFYQPNFKAKYRSFVIDSNNKKWGSCSSERHLTFHWKLILFPISAIDYVVVHELSHMRHMNHDRSFWRLVGKVYPEYKETMKILGVEKNRGL